MGGLLGPRTVRVVGTAETEGAAGKPSVWPPVPSDLSIGSYICSSQARDVFSLTGLFTALYNLQDVVALSI